MHVTSCNDVTTAYEECAGADDDDCRRNVAFALSELRSRTVMRCAERPTATASL